MVAEEQALKRSEMDVWNRKLVVDNKHFRVNTKPVESQQTEKYRGLREESVKKIGLRLATSRVNELVQRQVLATKIVSNPPISANALCEDFQENQTAYKPQKGLLPDFNKTPVQPNGNRYHENFNRHTREGVTEIRALSNKVFIQPLRDSEKIGNKWSCQSTISQTITQ